jgi:hypothetical protein
MEQPNEQHYGLAEILYIGLKFVTKHILGLLSIMFGVVAKVYVIRKEYRRIGKWQCRISVFFSGLSGTIAYMVLIDVDMIDWKKAVIIGFMPIVVEPIMTRILIWINPIIDSIGEFIKSKIKNKNE